MHLIRFLSVLSFRNSFSGMLSLFSVFEPLLLFLLKPFCFLFVRSNSVRKRSERTSWKMFRCFAIRLCSTTIQAWPKIFRYVELVSVFVYVLFKTCCKYFLSLLQINCLSRCTAKLSRFCSTLKGFFLS